MRQEKRLPIVVPVGVFTDDTTMTPPGPKVTDVNGVRPTAGYWENIGGWTALGFSAGGGGKCRSVLPWIDEPNGQVTVFADRANVSVYVGLTGTAITITPTGYGTGLDNTTAPLDIDGRSRTVALDLWGQNLLICPIAGTISIWDNSASPAAVIANAPDKCNWMINTPERQVIAFGCNETGGTYNPRCIRGSDLEDYTDWTPSSSNNSFEHILEDDGIIITARRFGRFVAVWTTTSVWLGQFIGDFDQTYRFDRVASNAGAISTGSIVIIDQAEGPTAYWIGSDLVPRMWTLGGQPQQIVFPIRGATLNSTTITSGIVAQGPKVWGLHIKKFNEVWWFYPDSRDATSECSRYIVYCIDESRREQRPIWTFGIMARCGGTDSPVLADPYMVDTSNQIQRHETGQTKTGAADWHITIGDIRFGEGEQRYQIQTIFPDFKSQAGTVTLTPYSRATPQSTETTHTAQSLTANLAKKDFRVSGMIFRLKFSGSTATDFMRMGRHSLQIATLGGR